MRSSRLGCPLEDYIIPIESGLTPQHGAGVLDKDRAADLDRRLRQLHAARRRAWTEIRTWSAVDQPKED